jgi:DNA repair protein RadB
MMDTKISSGIPCIDWLLEGGFEKGVITTIYGPAGSGKSNIALILAKEINKGKIIFIDTEGSFSVSRFRQITDNIKEDIKNIIVLNPTNFDEQKKAFKEINNLLNKDITAIIVDSIAMLYRLEIGKSKNIYEVNKQLGIQLGQLTEIARKNNIPILITNQVYSDFEQKDKVNIVGGDLLKYQSKCLIELQKTGDGLRKAIIRKHRSIEEGKEIFFKIVDSGIEEVKLEKY